MFKLISLITLGAFQIQVITSQCLGRPPSSLNCNRQLPEIVMESPGNCNCQTPVQLQPPVIERPVTNLPMTLITDCTPSVCKNLANTIQLMIVANLLKNGKGPDMAVELGLPILNNIISSPALSCGCSNPLFSNPLVPKIANPSVISPSFPPNLVSNSFYPNVLPSNLISRIIPGMPPNVKNVVF